MIFICKIVWWKIFGVYYNIIFVPILCLTCIYYNLSVREVFFGFAGHLEFFAGHLIEFNSSSSPHILKIRWTCPASPANFAYTVISVFFPVLNVFIPLGWHTQLSSSISGQLLFTNFKSIVEINKLTIPGNCASHVRERPSLITNKIKHFWNIVITPFSWRKAY